ncbi:E3 ubiquitin-protein ligase BOI-like [Bidens hawaiensis]|uniref:E3 ubiquitin-protein ligase BOI-like n=1 Tax=Bidens hawaiensis TaxID=980011 RepID=UPI00404B85AE
MAVQAQCSSNILLQPIDHQSLNNTFFNNFENFETNQGKRRRDDNMNRFMPNVDVSTGLRLAFNDHHQHQHQQHAFDPQSSGFVSLHSEDVSNLINQQGVEIEHYLQAQGEEFRRTLAEQRQRHYHALIVAAKESASRMIREKEAVAEKAARRNAELEARASQLNVEAKVWQAKARAQEAIAASLHAQLQQAMVTEVGACESRGEEDAESSYIDPERVVVVSGPGCKACGKRVASVVLLPCRHLCVCSECDDVVQACPLCLSLRSSSIEVYMS